MAKRVVAIISAMLFTAGCSVSTATLGGRMRNLFCVATLLGLYGCAGLVRTVQRVEDVAAYVRAHPKEHLTVIPVRSVGMVPTIRNGDIVLVNRAAYSRTPPRRGDIVIIQARRYLIERIVGVAGDRVEIRGGSLYLNGVPQSESYIAGPANYVLKLQNYHLISRYPDAPPEDLIDGPAAALPPRRSWQSADRVPAGYYIVLGDNRNDSLDSHILGFVSRAFVIGKVVKII